MASTTPTHFNRLRRFSGSRRLRGRVRNAALPWLILAGVAFAAVLVAVVLGNMLGARATDVLLSAPDGIPRRTGTVPVPDVCAESFRLGYSADALRDSGADAVCFPLADEDGTLCYRSSAAQVLGRPDKNGTLSLPGEMEYLTSLSLRKSGVLPLFSPNASEEHRAAEEAYELALVREAAEAGIDEILLLGTALDGGDKDAPLLALADRARTVAGKTALGVIAEPGCFTADGAETRLRGYLSHVDLLLIDLRGETDTARVAALLNEAVYCVHAFPVRLLVLQTDTDLIRFLRGGGYHNLEISP